ncbi:MAG: alpha/beta hydrolase family protein [Sciscionella sp.]
MTMIADYGTWESPIGADLLAASTGAPRWLGYHCGALYWTEPRPDEGGRLTLMRFSAGTRTELLPAPFNVRNRVHEYGGRSWIVVGETLLFTNWDDQRIYALSLAEGRDPAAFGPVAVTPEPEQAQAVRYSNLTAGVDGELWCVRERVTGIRPADVTHEVVALRPEDPQSQRVLVATHHFLASPSPSPDGSSIAWLGWEHPAMPWDRAELCVADLEATGVAGPYRVLAGGGTAQGGAESVCQFDWTEEGSLVALVDPEGWWNLHRIDRDGTRTALAPMPRECGGPLWNLGMRWFLPLPGQRYALVAGAELLVVDEAAGTMRAVPGLDEFNYFAGDLAASQDTLFTVAGGPHRLPALIGVDLRRGGYTEITGQPDWLPAPGYLSTPSEEQFSAPDGSTVPAFVYPPTNQDYTGPEGSEPPYLVFTHGGPTGSVHGVLDMEVSYFTSRGIGVVAVNYGGSSGYGRSFRERLREQWGVVDVQDCAAVATELAARGIADASKLAIRGGSAGGWTTAASLTTTSVYACGTVMYPVLDVTTWTGADGETHDFESRYIFVLVLPYPECAERYAQRSPITHLATLDAPVLMLQGLEDKICPPAQADRFMAALAGSGVPHAYLRFPGEQHGFRRAETVIAAAEAELSFYGQVFGFEPKGVPRLELSS